MEATIENLTELFDCEPEYNGLENEKPYAFASFHTVSKDIKVTLRIMVPIGEFSLKAYRNDSLFFDYQSSTSSIVLAEIFEDKHLLIIKGGEKAQTHIRIKPDFFVAHEIRGF